MKFRAIPKRTLQAKIPVKVIEELGLKAVKEGRPDNEVVTRLLCLGLGLDPSKYGIESASPASTN